MIEGLLFLFMINCSVTIQLAEQIMVLGRLAIQLLKAFFPKEIRGVTKEGSG
jgi:hypothetical protein